MRHRVRIWRGTWLAGSRKRASLYNSNRRLPVGADPARCRRHHGMAESVALPLTDPFVIEEDESLVLNNRGPTGGSELVTMEWRNRQSTVVEVVFSIKDLIADEIVDIPVELVGPGLGNTVDDPAGGPAILRRIVAGQNRKLLNRVHAQIDAQRAARRSIRIVVDADPIDPVIILEWLVPGDGQKSSVASIAPIAGSRLDSDTSDSRLERCQVRLIAAVPGSLALRAQC